MKRIVDKGLLLAGGLLMAGQSGRLAAPVIALLLATTAAAYGSCVDNRRWHCVCLAGMFAVCFILPELCFFVPVLLYDCAEKKEMRLWFLSVPGLAFFYREQIIRQPFLWAADGMLIVAAIRGVKRQNSVSEQGDDPSSGYLHGIESGAAGKKQEPDGKTGL